MLRQVFFACLYYYFLIFPAPLEQGKILQLFFNILNNQNVPLQGMATSTTLLQPVSILKKSTIII